MVWVIACMISGALRSGQANASPMYETWPGGDLRVFPNLRLQGTSIRVGDDALLGVLMSAVEIAPADFALRVARVTSAGVAPPDWTLDGAVVTRLAAAPSQFETVADGSGGCFSAWISLEGAEYRVRVQHLDAQGRVEPNWPSDGMLVGRAVWGSFLRLVRDGPEGLLVLAVTSDPFGRPQHHGVRLSPSGTVAHGWGPEWVQLTFHANSGSSPVRFDLSDVVVMADQRVHLVGTRRWDCPECEPLSSGSDVEHTAYGEGGGANQHFTYLRSYFSSSFGSIHPLPDRGWYVKYWDGPEAVLVRVDALGSTLWKLGSGTGVGLYGILYMLDGFDFILGDDSWVSRRDGDGAVVPGWEGFSLVPHAPNDYWLRPVLSDGMGGAFMAWSGYATNPSGYNLFVKAQHVPAGGASDIDPGIAPLVVSSYSDVSPWLGLLHQTRAEAGAMLVVWYEVDETAGIRVLAQKLTLDAAVPVRAHYLSSRVVGDAIELTWFVSGERAAVVRGERRMLDGDWTVVGEEQVDGRDRVVIRDASARPGTTYEYRIELGGRVIAHSGPITVAVGSDEPSVLLLGPGARGALRVRVVNPDETPAELEAFDLSGRRLGELAVAGRVESELLLPLSGQPAGLCFLRLRCASGTVVSKASIVR